MKQTTSTQPTLADRCNNPLNIRFNPANQWRGQTGEHRGFCVFKSKAYGMRAAYVLITNYIKNGYNTIESIVGRWAPPSENDTENYIHIVTEETLIPRELTLTDNSIHDYWTKLMILRAMAKVECGIDYEEQTINLYINYPEKY